MQGQFLQLWQFRELQAISPTETLLSFVPPEIPPTTQTGKDEGTEDRRQSGPTLSRELSRCDRMGASVHTSVKRGPRCLLLTVVSCPRPHTRVQERRAPRHSLRPLHTAALPPRGGGHCGLRRADLQTEVSCTWKDAMLHISSIPITSADQVLPTRWTHVGQCHLTCLAMS